MKLFDIKQFLISKDNQEKLQVLDEYIQKPPDTENIVQQCNTLIIKDISFDNSYHSKVGSNLFSDIELLKSYNGDTHDTVFDKINMCVLHGSQNYLEYILSNPVFDVNILEQRQNIIQKLENKYDENIESKLKEISTLIPDIIWLYEAKDEDVSYMYDMVYFSSWFLQKLNSNDKVLTGYNWYRIFVSPTIGLLSPITYILIPYLVIRIKMGIKIQFVPFIKMLFTTMFNASDMMFMGKFGKLKYISYAFSLLFYFQGLFNCFEMAKALYKVNKVLSTKINNIIRFIQIAKHTYDTYWDEDIIKYFFNDEQNNKRDMKDINFFENFKTSSTFQIFSNFGKQLQVYKQINREDYVPFLKRCFMIDSLLSIVRIKKKHELTNVEFSTQDKPMLRITKIFHPCLDIEKCVRNDIHMGHGEISIEDNQAVLNKTNTNNIILTGPNAGGKSTLLKSILINILLSQTITISMSERSQMTPFYYINSQINIPDCKGKESLFEAEMYRSKDNLDKLKELQGKKSIIVMDEIFNSTNPVEGIAGAYAIAKNMSMYENNLSIISTHYLYLTKLAKELPSHFTNFKMNVSINQDQDISFPYILSKGISKQYIALELLKKNGFDEDLIEDAMIIKNRLIIGTSLNKDKDKDKQVQEKVQEKQKEETKLEQFEKDHIEENKQETKVCLE